MHKRNLAGPVITRLAEAPGNGCKSRRFASEGAWMAHLEQLGITALNVHPEPVRIATEGALWGAIQAHGLLADTVILSDDAGQFNVGRHALCWVHAERLIHKLDAFTDHQRREKERIQARLWSLYAALKAYRRKPSKRLGGQLARRFDALFTSKTGFITLDRLLARIHANRLELLVVLDRPEVPLNTNGSEKRHPRHGHPAKTLRRHPLAIRQAGPRHLHRADEDLPQARDLILALSRRPSPGPERNTGAISTRPRQTTMHGNGLAARSFAPGYEKLTQPYTIQRFITNMTPTVVSLRGWHTDA